MTRIFSMLATILVVATLSFAISTPKAEAQGFPPPPFPTLPFAPYPFYIDVSQWIDSAGPGTEFQLVGDGWCETDGAHNYRVTMGLGKAYPSWRWYADIAWMQPESQWNGYYTMFYGPVVLYYDVPGSECGVP